MELVNVLENEHLSMLNHSCAHMMAQAVKRLYPNAKFWVGPVISEGFYYDMDLGDVKLKEEDLAKIEKEMKKIAKDGKRIVREEISKEDAAEGKVKVTKAAIQMGRINPNYTVKNELLIRDWAQVKYADAVFAVTTLLQAGDKIDSTRIAKISQGKGGTGYAIQMAINEGKPVYVYDQEKNQWFTYKNNTWVKTDTPVLTKNFAGIGTRNLNEKGKKAIEDVFNKTFAILNNNENESNIEDITNTSDTEKQTKKDNINIWYSSNENAEL